MRACEVDVAALSGAFRRGGNANRRGGNARCAVIGARTGRSDSYAWGLVPYVVIRCWGPDPYGKRDVWGTDPYGGWVVGRVGTFVLVTMHDNGATWVARVKANSRCAVDVVLCCANVVAIKL